MTPDRLAWILSGTILLCLGLERRVAWIVHISGVCLIIMVALLLASLGIIPNAHPLYDFFSGPNIPIAIAMMVFALDLRDVIHLPFKLLLIFGIGIIASATGSVVAGVLAAPQLGDNAAKLAAQFAASYIGGGENCVVMKKILDIPNELFVAGFAVDNIVTSLWMVATIVFAKSVPVELHLNKEEKDTQLSDGQVTTLVDVVFSITVAFLSIEISHFLSTHFGFVHPLLYLSFVAFVVSQLPWVRERLRPAYLIGTLLFAPFFFSIGAISDVRSLASLPIAVILMPILVVLIHGILIYLAGYLLKVPSLETSLASQSLIGGPATAVALAQVKKWRSGVSMGLCIGLVGYATANYFSMGVYHLTLFLIHARK